MVLGGAEEKSRVGLSQDSDMSMEVYYYDEA